MLIRYRYRYIDIGDVFDDVDPPLLKTPKYVELHIRRWKVNIVMCKTQNYGAFNNFEKDEAEGKRSQTANAVS